LRQEIGCRRGTSTCLAPACGSHPSGWRSGRPPARPPAGVGGRTVAGQLQRRAVAAQWRKSDRHIQRFHYNDGVGQSAMGCLWGCWLRRGTHSLPYTSKSGAAALTSLTRWEMRPRTFSDAGPASALLTLPWLLRTQQSSGAPGCGEGHTPLNPGPATGARQRQQSGRPPTRHCQVWFFKAVTREPQRQGECARVSVPG